MLVRKKKDSKFGQGTTQKSHPIANEIGNLCKQTQTKKIHKISVLQFSHTHTYLLQSNPENKIWSQKKRTPPQVRYEGFRESALIQKASAEKNTHKPTGDMHNVRQTAPPSPPAPPEIQRLRNHGIGISRGEQEGLVS